MKCLDLTLPTPAANLACDEALLDACEENSGEEILRFWEPREYFVVVGYANKIASEVNLEICRENKIPVLRRCSGGGTVLQGPGCLNYSLVLQIDGANALQSITATNQFVMERHRETLSAVLDLPVQCRGLTDLSIGEKKFSGNAQRRKRQALIFHGTFLLDFDLSLVQKFLSMPSKEPDYRLERSHQDFLINLKISADTIKSALQKSWGAKETQTSAPDFAPLLESKYARDEWNLKF